ncbi:hypothetical protein CVT24_001898 [Panaeolus cyanescens]|uniref:F-box domain-containing protein n=1 Tax=Panaeolus cyanescens TaxID=181874 RepID=A0A409YEL5_9AGAR|nr:hypothetical protein CVT24_001898 [Panaeolus cyanescens]
MSARRSARIKAKHVSAEEPSRTEAALDSLLPSEEDEPVAAKPKARGKKRKSAPGQAGADSGRQAKKPRMRGSLERVLNMPFDLLPEIFGHLEPQDLLNLSRTSKDLRNLLMSRSSRSIWLQSMANAPEMVDCPSYISEPAWIDYLFGKGCMGCGKNTNATHTLEREFIRLCMKCVKERLTAIKDLTTFAATRVYPISVAINNGLYPLSANSNIMYLEPSRDERWTKEYKALTTDEARTEWEERTLAEEGARIKIARACSQLWARRHLRLEDEMRQLQMERKKQIVEHIRKMGWGEEIDKAGGDFPSNRLHLISFIYQKNITPRILSNWESYLRSIMQSMKNERLAREQRSCWKTRMTKFSNIASPLIVGLSEREPRPGLRDVFECQRVKDLVFKTSPEVTLEDIDFGFVNELLPEIVQHWRESASAQLVAKIRSTMGVQHDIDPSTVLSLATSVFACDDRYPCFKRSLWFSDALAHPCCTPPSSQNDVGMENEPTYLHFARKPWSAKTLQFRKFDYNVISQVVELCGLDPATATIEQMNALDHVFECTKCRKPSSGRQVMNWQGVLQHFRQVHGHFLIDISDIVLVILDGEDAQKAKEKIAEVREKRMYQEHFKILCMHCSHSGKLASIRRHILQRHDNVPVPKEGVDFMLSGKNPNCYQVSPAEIWPPYVDMNDDGDLEEDDNLEESELVPLCVCGRCHIFDDDDNDDDDSEMDDDDDDDYWW